MNNIRWISEKAWVAPTYRTAAAVGFVLIGAYGGTKGIDSFASVGVLVIAVFLVILEYLCAESASRIRHDLTERAEGEKRQLQRTCDDNLQNLRKELEAKIGDIQRAAEDKVLKIEGELEIHFASISFLTSKLQNATWRLRGLAGERTQRGPSWDAGYLRAEIDDALRAMCTAFSAMASRRYRKSLADVWFRATFMDIQVGDSTEVLSYCAWYTPDGHAPRSKSIGTTYTKGHGVAGIAWQRARPVIEDKFDHNREWVENYPGQGSRYESMVCVPAVRTAPGEDDEVVGVITVDTTLTGFFGQKDNRSDEEIAGKWMRPYADYIALVVSLGPALSTDEEGATRLVAREERKALPAAKKKQPPSP